VSVRELVKVQRTKGVKRIADKNPAQGAPAPDEFRLQNAAVRHLLVETPEKVRKENRPHAPQEMRLGKHYPRFGEKESASETTHVTNDGRKSLPPKLMKSTQLAIKKGKLANRNASNQKQDEHSRRRANPRSLTAFATVEDRVGNAILRSIFGLLLNPDSAQCGQNVKRLFSTAKGKTLLVELSALLWCQVPYETASP